jgi:drug/metabolite transporter (DMT)-like permease
MFLGEIAALATSFLWALTSIFFTYGGREVGSVVVNRSRLLFAALIVPALHLALEGSLLPLNAEAFRWEWLGLSAVLGLVIGDAFLFQAFVTVGPRLSQTIMALVPIFTTVLAWFLFGETVNAQELAGIILAVGGVTWVVSERRGRVAVESKQYGRGILFALGGALGQATGLITSRLGLVGDFPPISGNVIRLLVATLVVWGFTLLRGRIGFTVSQWRNRKALRAILGGTIVGPVLGVWMSLAAIQLARVGIASTLMSLAPIILLPLGALFLNERITPRSVVGTLAAISGVALIFLA